MGKNKNKKENNTGLKYDTVVPEGVKEIGIEEYMGEENVGNVYLPDSCEKIWPRAFLGSDVESITASNITELGNAAFEKCRLLFRAILPESVKKIGDRCFKGCTALEEAYIPYGVEEVGENVFDGCVSLSILICPEHILQKLVHLLEANNNLKRIYIIDKNGNVSRTVERTSPKPKNTDFGGLTKKPNSSENKLERR